MNAYDRYIFEIQHNENQIEWEKKKLFCCGVTSSGYFWHDVFINKIIINTSFHQWFWNKHKYSKQSYWVRIVDFELQQQQMFWIY